MPTYTVSEIARHIRDVIDSDGVLRDLYITGEVSNSSRYASGHTHFTLKDAKGQLRGVMFKTGTVGAEFLTNGASVTAHGKIRFYAERGELQLYADLVQPEGVGELHMKFLLLKTKLQEEGLFELSRKRSLPKWPKRVAIITSRSGAVWHDIQNIVRRRYPLIELCLIHTAVQGEQAAPGVVDALKLVNRTEGLDLVVVARGGGSLEELWAFNTEEVARAIHACRIPVVSAVGHETDTTIADFVADLRAPTPSAAAELIVPQRAHLQQQIRELSSLAKASVLDLIRRHRQEVRHSILELEHAVPDFDMYRQRIDELSRTASALLLRETVLCREQVRGFGLQLAALKPANTLARGYAVVERTADGAVVSRTAQVRAGDGLVIHVRDGDIGAAVGAEPSAPVVSPAVPAPVPAHPHGNGRRVRKAPAPEQIPLFGQ